MEQKVTVCNSPGNIGSYDNECPFGTMSKIDLLKIMILLVTWFVTYYPLYTSLVQDWLYNSDNSHAFLVPFITLFFVYQKKDQLKTTSLSTSVWGGVILAASLLVYIISYGGGIEFPARLSMVTSLFGILWFCLGSGFVRLLIFPTGFLLFMIPVPYSIMNLISMPLQLMVTKISAKLIEGCSIPVYREGNMLYFMQTQLEVAEACSGIRSIMSLLMLSLLLGYLSRDGWWRKVFLFAAAIPVALLANIARVTGTGILAHFYGDGVARGFIHEFSGLLIFIVGFALLFVTFLITNKIKVEKC